MGQTCDLAQGSCAEQFCRPGHRLPAGPSGRLRTLRRPKQRGRTRCWRRPTRRCRRWPRGPATAVSIGPGRIGSLPPLSGCSQRVRRWTPPPLAGLQPLGASAGQTLISEPTRNRSAASVYSRRQPKRAIDRMALQMLLSAVLLAGSSKRDLHSTAAASSAVGACRARQERWWLFCSEGPWTWWPACRRRTRQRWRRAAPPTARCCTTDMPRPAGSSHVTAVLTS